MEFISVSSSNISAVGYDRNTHVLDVVFHGGREYTYSGVPENIYNNLISAGSVGRYFASFVKNNYPYSQIR